jgi:hypothetical protein
MKRRDILVWGGALAAYAPLLARGVACPPPSVSLDGTTASTTCATGAAADWNARISGSGVVWYHKFDSAAEVNQFRWTGGYAGGNDPNGTGTSLSKNTAWVSSGGPGGGGYLRLSRPAGTQDGSDWRRPFSPLTAASNGRGAADPGANGSLTAQIFAPTQGGNQLLTYATPGRSKQGWYTNAAYTTSVCEGTDFYIQLRVRNDPQRTAPGNQTNGKFVWLNTTNQTNPNQEIVTVTQYVNGAGNASAVGEPNFHNAYTAAARVPGQGIGSNVYLSDAAIEHSGTRIQLGSSLGVCDPYNRVNSGCWAYATDGSWDTLLYHITPGTDDGTGANATRFEVWAAHQGQASYAKIWDIHYGQSFSLDGNSSGGVDQRGWNCLSLSTYTNGFTGLATGAFRSDFADIIFSRAMIAIPQY